MGRTHHGTPKRQGGLSLIPELWAEIDRFATRAGVPRNQVIETVLMREFGFAPDSQKPRDKSRSVQSEEIELAS